MVIGPQHPRSNRCRRLKKKGTTLRIVFAGTPVAAVPSLQALLGSGHEIVAVITRADAPAGRGRGTVTSPIADLARGAGIEVLTPASAKDPELLQRLRDLRPEAAAVVAYGKILPPEVLAVPAHGWVNLHFSLLPAWRGAAPVQAAIRAGDDLTGATTFRLTHGLDTGPVFGRVTEPVRPADTAGELLERLSRSGAHLLLATLDGLAGGTIVPVDQRADGVSLAPKITVADAEIRWDVPAMAVDRHVRSVTPEPGGWTSSTWGRLVVGPVQLVLDAADGAALGQSELKPGELLVSKREVLVGTGTGPVRLSTVQAPGKRAIAAADWARGARPPAGTVIGAPAPEVRAAADMQQAVELRSAENA